MMKLHGSNGSSRAMVLGLGIALLAILLSGCSSWALAPSAAGAPAAQATPGNQGTYGPGGMMGQGGPNAQATPGPNQQGWGPGGMMGPGGYGSTTPNWGQGMMGGMAGMMGGPYSPDVTPISLADAAGLVDRYLQSLGNADLAYNEIHSFTYNFYVPVYEKSTNNFAFELLVDRFGGGVVPEMGPNMVWNSKYGTLAGSMMGPRGMMGGWWGGQSQSGNQQNAIVETPVGEAQAVGNAQRFLDRFMPGATTGEVHNFYGYRTIDVERDGKMVGMLSVDGYNGAIWYHTWHGDFLENWER